jgi:hypothetical protein
VSRPRSRSRQLRPTDAALPGAGSPPAHRAPAEEACRTAPAPHRRPRPRLAARPDRLAGREGALREHPPDGAIAALRPPLPLDPHRCALEPPTPPRRPPGAAPALVPARERPRPRQRAAQTRLNQRRAPPDGRSSRGLEQRRQPSLHSFMRCARYTDGRPRLTFGLRMRLLARRRWRMPDSCRDSSMRGMLAGGRSGSLAHWIDMPPGSRVRKAR